MTLDDIQKIIAARMRPLRTAALSMIAKAILDADAKDSSKMQQLKLRIRKGEVRDAIERLQEYGLTSVPFAGAEAVCLFVGGDRDHPLVIAVDDRRYRLKGLAGGEVALYDDLGQVIHLKRDKIHIKTETKVVVDSPNIELTADAAQKVLRGDVFKAFFDAHIHIDGDGRNTTTPTVAMPENNLSTKVKVN